MSLWNLEFNYVEVSWHRSICKIFFSELIASSFYSFLWQHWAFFEFWLICWPVNLVQFNLFRIWLDQMFCNDQNCMILLFNFLLLLFWLGGGEHRILYQISGWFKKFLLISDLKLGRPCCVRHTCNNSCLKRQNVDPFYRKLWNWKLGVNEFDRMLLVWVTSAITWLFSFVSCATLPQMISFIFCDDIFSGSWNKSSSWLFYNELFANISLQLVTFLSVSLKI